MEFSFIQSVNVTLSSIFSLNLSGNWQDPGAQQIGQTWVFRCSSFLHSCPLSRDWL